MDFERFVRAQDEVYAQVQQELAAGQKRTHWMWFVFPQLRGLGSSAMAERYALAGVPEAVAYLEHPVLGARLRECTGLVNAVKGKGVEQIFGFPDDLKFRSSMTLFARAAEGDSVFVEALQRFFGGEPDPATLARIGE